MHSFNGHVTCKDDSARRRLKRDRMGRPLSSPRPATTPNTRTPLVSIQEGLWLSQRIWEKANAKDFLPWKPTTSWVFWLEWMIIIALSQNMGFFPHQPHFLPLILHMKNNSIVTWHSKLKALQPNKYNEYLFKCTFERTRKERPPGGWTPRGNLKCKASQVSWFWETQGWASHHNPLVPF